MTNAKKRIIGIFIVTLWFAAWAMPAIFDDHAIAMPQDGTTAAGGSTISQPDANTMHINQSTDTAIINWQGYSIGTNETVQYFQPNSGSISLNRVTGQDPSLIYGQLSANGRVWVINPNGLLIGQDAKINVGGFIASTLDITDQNFLNGNYRFTGASTSLSSITNKGNINAANGGYVVFISPTINNQGSITANNGSVNMASGDDVTLTFANNGLINLVINKQAATDALGIDNGGTITADGGQVILNAQTAADLLKTVVNNTGVIQARTLENKNGVIRLLGGMDGASVNAIRVGGTLDASAPDGGDGGFIETSAASVKTADDVKVTTTAANGKTGEWLIDPTDYTIAAAGGDITGAALSANLGTTDVIILSSSGGTGANGDVNVNDAVSWGANTLTLTAARDININAVMTASGTSVLALNTATANGADSAVAGGTVKTGFNTDGTFKGRVDFPGRSGTGLLTINGSGYTVINSLGVAGSSTQTDLQGIEGNAAGNYALGSDIDATATSTWNAGAGFLPFDFTGAFDGLGHVITGLTINRPTSNNIGLFGNSNGAAIRNVGVVDCNVTGNTYTGGLVGYSGTDITITNSYSTGAVTGGFITGGLVGGVNGNANTITNSYSTSAVSGTDNVGGLVGDSGIAITITDSYSTGAVIGTDTVGGLVGYRISGLITGSYSTGAVNGSGSYTGGLVGRNYSGTITNSYSTGVVTGVDYTGGLVGDSGTGITITDSYSTGAVNGTSYTGGLMGNNTSGLITGSYSTGAVNGGGSYTGGLVGHNNTFATITDSYSTGVVNGSGTGDVGGLVGSNDSGTITNSYSTSTVSGTSDVGGLVGSNYSGTITNSYSTGVVNGAYNVGGLVGRNNDSGTITDSYSTGAVSNSGDDTGGLVGYNYSGTITNSYSTGAVNGSGKYTGGLVGYNYSGQITNSYSTGVVNGAYRVGGLVGDTYDGQITGSYSTGVVNGSSYYTGGLAGYQTYGLITNSYSTGVVNGSDIYTGGLVGYTESGTIAYSYSTGAVSGSGSYTGGLVGYTTSATITNSYSTGAVSGTDYTGGLVGDNYKGQITNSYSTGAVSNSGDFTGGLVGRNTLGTITDSYSTGAVTGANYVGGLVGRNALGTITNSYWDTETSGQSTSSGGTGKTTAQMMEQATFNGWDFVVDGIWRIYEGKTYPLLKSFLTSLTVTANDDAKTYNGAAYAGGSGVTYSVTSPTLLGAPTYNGTSQGAINKGSYTITPGGYWSDQQGYDIISYVNGTLTVDPAPLTITADNQTKVYGDANPVLTATYVGLMGSDTSSVVSGLILNTAATAASNVGPYVIAASVATASNYAITHNNGTLTIAPVTQNNSTLTLTSNNDNVTQEGLLANLPASYVNDPAPQEAEYQDVYAAADPAVLAFTAGGRGALITDYRSSKARAKHQCLIVKEDGDSIVDADCM